MKVTKLLPSIKEKLSEHENHASDSIKNMALPISMKFLDDNNQQNECFEYFE